jgi:mannose-1-phosphate guanylyltransferase
VSELHAIIMAGGSGTRFWPLSRARRPKHLLSLFGPQTLLAETIERVKPLVGPDRLWIVTGADHADQVREEAADLASEAIVVEPCRRDTAPCIGLAAALICRQSPEAIMAVLPADHKIEPVDVFRQELETAARLVEDDPSRLVTFGMKPTRPATGYGYIERGKPLSGYEAPCYTVKKFHEKPKQQLAERYVAAGTFYWNSGIFVWKARTILAELERHKPLIAKGVQSIAEAWDSPERDEVLRREYERIEKRSIDYAVMERAENVVVVEAAFHWDDVGTWAALVRLRGEDEQGNTIVGKHCGLDTKDTLVFADDHHLVATVGVEGLIVVRTDDVTLVVGKEYEERVKDLVESLRQRGLEQYL